MRTILFASILFIINLKIYCQETIYEQNIKLTSGLSDVAKSQEILFQQNVELTSLFKDKRESLPIVDSSNNEIALFLFDNKDITGLLFKDKFDLRDNYIVDRPEKKFKQLLGYSVDSSGYHLFFSNEKNTQFYTKSINIEKKLSKDKIQEIKLKDEKYLETISYKNKFYLLTVKKESSILKLYVFEGSSLSKTELFDFSQYRFSNTEYPKLYYVLEESTSTFQMELKVQKTDCSNPVSLDISTKANKLYYHNDKIYITIDNSIDFTKLISIDLNDYTSFVKTFLQGRVECGDAINVKSNSYIHGDFLFQIGACRHELYFSVHNILNDSLINSYRVTKDEGISFRNTPVIQEGGVFLFQDSEKELDRTKQILRKISASDVGISAYKSNDNFIITIGGYKVDQNNGGMGGMAMSSPGTTFSTPNGTISEAPTYHYNPTMYGYGTYTNTRSVYFKTLLENAYLNHVPGNIPNNAFDKIKDYEDSIESEMTSETIFKVGDFYVFGYYDRYTKKYYLMKFTD